MALFFKPKPEKKIAQFIDAFTNSIGVTTVIVSNRVLDTKNKAIFFAAIYGAADAFAQLNKLSRDDAIRGIAEYFIANNISASEFKDCIYLANRPENYDVVTHTGNAVIKYLRNPDYTSAVMIDLVEYLDTRCT